MLVITREFMLEHKIDVVVHAFSNTQDTSNQDSFFQIPREMNRFLEIEYNHGISTTQIIEKQWPQIWIKKGSEDTGDLFKLNGWEQTSFDVDFDNSKYLCYTKF